MSLSGTGLRHSHGDGENASGDLEDQKPGVLFVTHEIDEALTVATRIAVLTPRPTTIQTWITLPGREGRDASGAGTDGDPAGNYWSHHSLIVVAVAME